MSLSTRTTLEDLIRLLSYFILLWIFGLVIGERLVAAVVDAAVKNLAASSLEETNKLSLTRAWRPHIRLSIIRGSDAHPVSQLLIS